jgi:riboflavin synthase
MMTVPKGSITVNGVSLTVVDSTPQGFSVAIIPYTYEHTNFKNLAAGDSVNLEFDILGKYLQRMMMK